MNNNKSTVNNNVESSTQSRKDLRSQQIDLINCIKVSGAGVFSGDKDKGGCEDCPTDRV
ncbi:hypothetical protein SG34_019045 [Thalassomonas viridans]|uniref:Uncharacterized protein n=1 Tax=Thalassomonas viridans TaxID=137584 RepID=A0AAF0C7A2_9GAMM|nr:hypothetical protein [Thalassomonas viridans]WDE03478.1 hypothetical protein SG34_019045 [Thalassomonas viridans]